MSNVNLKPSDRATLIGVVDPDVTVASTVTTGWVAMSSFEAIQAIILAGTLGTSATLDAKLEQATSAAGAGAKDITGKAITQLSEAGTDDSDKQAVINCWADELDVDNSFTHVRLSMTLAVATSDLGAVILGLNARYQPPTDATTVAEVVT